MREFEKGARVFQPLVPALLSFDRLIGLSVAVLVFAHSYENITAINHLKILS